jgi:AraC-like DNA-binding protein
MKKIADPGMFVGNSMSAGNLLVYSRLNELFHEWKGGHSEVGIKYVISGTEKYVLNKKTYHVSDGCFLLVNKGQDHEVSLPYSAQPVHGLCMSLTGDVLNDVLSNSNCAEEWMLDNPEGKDGLQFDFFEGIYRPDDVLTQYIASLGKILNKETGEVPLDSGQLFYGLAQHLLASQSLVHKKVWQINANRYSTRKELYRRTNTAKQIIDERFSQHIEMADLAGAVAMSEFHFFRTFRQVYGISPHQYQIKCRLENAKKMLLENKLTITETAFICGFADVQSFSKSFKKAFGISPAGFRK